MEKRHFRVAGGLADPDLTVTARAAVEPLRDAPDQPGLIALGGDAEQGLAGVGRVAEHAKAPLSRLETRGRRRVGSVIPPLEPYAESERDRRHDRRLQGEFTVSCPASERRVPGDKEAEAKQLVDAAGRDHCDRGERPQGQVAAHESDAWTHPYTSSAPRMSLLSAAGFRASRLSNSSSVDTFRAYRQVPLWTKSAKKAGPLDGNCLFGVKSRS